MGVVEGEWPRGVAKEIEIRQKKPQTISQGMKHYFMSGEIYYSMLCTLNSTTFSDLH